MTAHRSCAVDVGSVEWLVNFIRNLKCTVCLVSHDYDFNSEVLTDVIHICDGKPPSLIMQRAPAIPRPPFTLRL